MKDIVGATAKNYPKRALLEPVHSLRRLQSCLSKSQGRFILVVYRLSGNWNKPNGDESLSSFPRFLSEIHRLGSQDCLCQMTKTPYPENESHLRMMVASSGVCSKNLETSLCTEHIVRCSRIIRAYITLLAQKELNMRQRRLVRRLRSVDYDCEISFITPRKAIVVADALCRKER
ncbi:hypothetical protein Tco_0226555 [Tanacetum coccineum]